MHKLLNTHYSRFILEGVPETSQIFEDTLFYLNILAIRSTADVTGKSIVTRAQSISDASAVNPLIAFKTSIEERETCYFLVPSRTPHETSRLLFYNITYIHTYIHTTHA
jgi:hypothetical protein